MVIYIMRHAHALGRDEWTEDDALRPLTSKGKRATTDAAGGLANVKPHVSVILSSPYTRTRDTADIVARKLGVSVTLSDALTPGFDTAQLPEVLRLANWADGVLLVGHEPDLSGAISELAAPPQPVEMKKAACCCLATSADDNERLRTSALAGAWEIRWLRSWRELAALVGK